jgi:hypothetical protein
MRCWLAVKRYIHVCDYQHHQIMPDWPGKTHLVEGTAFIGALWRLRGYIAVGRGVMMLDVVRVLGLFLFGKFCNDLKLLS